MTKKKRLNKKGKRFLKMLLLLIIFVCIGIFLYNNKDKIKTKSEDNKEKEEEKVEEVKKLQIIDLDSNSRPYAVMINNISKVFGYQCGIQDAYLVYEIIVEGGYTRLMAVFKDKDLERIGTVRSSRHYFLDYALENDAIYVHFGWSPQAQSDIKSLGVDNINFMSYSGYWRDKSLGLATEHTAFTSTEKINDGIKHYDYRTTSDSKPVLNYSVDEVDISTLEGAKEANSVYIEYSSSRNTSFEYDPDLKIYKRFQNDKKHTDYVTGEQYTVKNIITYQVNNHTISDDNKGRQTIDNIGAGTGWYITNGYAVPIKWKKTSRNSKTIYTYMDGTEIKVNDGNTHIQIQPSGKKLEIEPLEPTEAQ